MGTTSSHFEESSYSPGMSLHNQYGFLVFWVFLFFMSILLHFKMTDSH